METLFFDPAREMLEKIISFISLSMVALLVVVFSLMGCQTVQGIGADIQWIGQKSEEAIEQ